jgi:hypothetical protein
LNRRPLRPELRAQASKGRCYPAFSLVTRTTWLPVAASDRTWRRPADPILLGTEDKAIPPALQLMAGRANATIVEVPASHVSFVSQPEAATQLIVRAVEAASHAESGTA